MRKFVEAGITTFDCADIYTGVEELIGDFIDKFKNEIRCGDLSVPQIHTKYVPDLEMLPYLTKQNTEAVIDRSLKRLKVERLDLVQFHWWDYSVPRYVETAGHLADLQKAGKIRFLGVTNFDAAHLREILDAGIGVVSNQVQYSVLDKRPEERLQKLCRQKGIFLLCYGTMGGGFLTERYLGIEEPKEPLENRSLVKYKLIIDEFGDYNLFQELLTCLKKIADKHRCSIAEIAVQYVLQKPNAAGVIIGARNADHLAGYQRISTLSLDKSDLADLKLVIEKAKGPKGPVYALERDRKGKHGRIMKYNLNRIQMESHER
jgi:aryl-alcohol dehydrogenase-like predicted oxidoreductase